MQFTLFTLLAAASTASAAALSGCDQGSCPDHNAPIDLIETNHNGGDVVTLSMRVSDGGNCTVINAIDRTGCEPITFHNRPAVACLNTDRMEGTLEFFDVNNPRKEPEYFCFSLAYEKEPQECITQIWWMDKWHVC